MDFDPKLVDQIARTGGMAAMSGWHYDLVIERLERTGFKWKNRIAFPVATGLEGALYSNDQGCEFGVITHRLDAKTWINATPSSEGSYN